VQIALKVGERMILFDESVRRGRWKKLSAKWTGPYVVLAVDGVNANIKRGRNAIKVHVNRLKPFYYGNEGNSTVPPRSREKDRKMVIIRDLFRLDKVFIDQIFFRYKGYRDSRWHLGLSLWWEPPGTGGNELRSLRAHLDYIMWICIIPRGKRLFMLTWKRTISR